MKTIIISVSFQFLVSPVLEIELEDKSGKIPNSGVNISLQHFMELPLLPEFARDSSDDVHQVIKLSSNDQGINHFVCGEYETIESEYFNVK